MHTNTTLLALTAGAAAFLWAPEVLACDTPNSATIYLKGAVSRVSQSGTISFPYRYASLAVNRLANDPSITRLCVSNSGGASLDLSSFAANSLTVEGWYPDGAGLASVNRTFGGQQGSMLALSYTGGAKPLTVRNIDIYGQVLVHNATTLTLDQVTLHQDIDAMFAQFSMVGTVSIQNTDMIGQQLDRALELTFVDTVNITNANITMSSQGAYDGIYVTDANSVVLNSVTLHTSGGSPSRMLTAVLVGSLSSWNSEFIDDDYQPGFFGPNSAAIYLDNINQASFDELTVDSPHALGVEGYSSTLAVTDSEFHGATRTGMQLEDVNATIERTTLDMDNGFETPAAAIWANNESLTVDDVFTSGPSWLSSGDVAFRFDGDVAADIRSTTAYRWRAFASLEGFAGPSINGSLNSRGNVMQGTGNNLAAMYLVDTGAPGMMSLSTGVNLLDSVAFAYNEANASPLAQGSLVDGNPEVEDWGEAIFISPGLSPELDCFNSDGVDLVPNDAWTYQSVPYIFGYWMYINPDIDFYGAVRGESMTAGADECNTISPFFLP